MADVLPPSQDDNDYCVTKDVYVAMFSRIYDLLVPPDQHRRRNVKKVIQVCLSASRCAGDGASLNFVFVRVTCRRIG